MADSFEIRAGVKGHLPAIETHYSDAFPDEHLMSLVTALLRDVPDTLSLPRSAWLIAQQPAEQVQRRHCTRATSDLPGIRGRAMQTAAYPIKVDPLNIPGTARQSIRTPHHNCNIAMHQS